ncbi:MAG: sigma-54-dependent Fis family transcriptional regulator [Deltaproteobacteria bacterium]|nr:sigma-54-dependent Fis family transcriptional regulator [Deltaproteobacteria bacterium]
MSRGEDAIGVLVVDDDPSVLRSWREILSDERYSVTLLGDPLEAERVLAGGSFDIAVIDIRMPELDGMELLSQVKSKYPEIEVVMMTGFGGVQDAVEAIKRGAYDFLSKPFESMEAAELTVRRAAELRRLERRLAQLESERHGPKIIGQSEPIKRMLEMVESVAASPATVLVVGESGTGKELLARAIHENSPRRQRALVTLNCSALPQTLLESELFGHVKGAFTGASQNHPGLFRSADGGTIFLDEIGDMALPTQATLLRTLQEGEVRPVGSTQTYTVDVRVIAATHLDLEKMCESGAFREDLYYRLNVIRIEVPPLRDRVEDIELLAQFFLRKHQAAVGKQFDGIDPTVLRALRSHPFRGNVRELENIIERAVAICRGKLITVADLPPSVGVGGGGGAAAAADPLQPASSEVGHLSDLSFADAKAQLIERFERQYLEDALANHGSVSAAARAVGLDRSNFRRLLRRHNLLRHN